MILITGVESSLTKAIQAGLSPRGETSLVQYSHNYLDTLTDSLNGGDDTLLILPPLQDIDYYEIHREDAYGNISIAVKKAAEFACQKNIPLIFISSVHVFNGRDNPVYSEESTPDPQSVFGDACHLAEQYFLDTGCTGCIIRTGELIGFGDWDLSPLLQKQKDRHTLDVPEGVITPSSVTGLAGCISTLMEKRATGIYHYCQDGKAGRHDVLQLILREMEARGLLAELPELSEKDYREIPLGAERLYNSVLDNSKFCVESGIKPESWQTSVVEYVESLK